MTFRLLMISCLLTQLIACTAKPEIIYQTEYIRVEVPVHYKLERPNRPKITQKDSYPGYLAKILEYTKLLETIIDECNKE